MTERVLPWLWAAWVAGRTVLLGDPGRRYLPGEGLVAVAGYDVPEVDEDRVRRTTSLSARVTTCSCPVRGSAGRT